MRSGTTRASRRARTTSSGRACSTSPTATTCPDPLVLYRVHPEQASQRRRELQRECQLRVARRMIAAVAPALSSTRGGARVARSVSAEQIAPDEVEAAVDAYLRLVDAFEQRAGRGVRPAGRPRPRADRRQLHRARHAHGSPVRRSGSTLGFRLHVIGRRRARRDAGSRTPRGRGLVAPAGSPGRPVGRPFASRRSSRSRRPTVRRSSTASPRTGRSTSRSCTRPGPSRAGRGASSRSTSRRLPPRPSDPRRASGSFITTTRSPRVSCRALTDDPARRWSSSRAGAPSPRRLRSRGAA